MASASLERSISLVFGHEGGYVNNPKDPGGPTKYGITQKTLAAWRKKSVSVGEVRELKLEEASEILRKQYWAPIRGDDLPAGLDHAVFDYAVNSGPSQAVKTLQRCVGSTPDGIMGARTLAALDGRDKASVVDEYCDARMAFLRGLKTFPTFGKGWITRVERVRKEAKSMTRGSVALQLTAPDDGFAIADPADTATSATTDGRAAGIAGIGVLGTAVSDAATQLAPYTAALPVLRWLFIGLTVIGIGIGLYATIHRINTGNA